MNALGSHSPWTNFSTSFSKPSISSIRMGSMPFSFILASLITLSFGLPGSNFEVVGIKDTPRKLYCFGGAISGYRYLMQAPDFRGYNSSS